MAAPLIPLAIAGGAMIAGGAGTAASGGGIRQDSRAIPLGNSAEEAERLRQQAMAGVQSSQQTQRIAQEGQRRLLQGSRGLGERGQGIGDAGAKQLDIGQTGMSRTYGDLRGLEGTATGESTAANVGADAGRATVDRGLLSALSVARSSRGGPGALRAAMRANQTTALQGAQQAQILAGQQQQAADAMRLQAQMANDRLRLGALQSAGQLAGQQAGLGLSQLGTGLNVEQNQLGLQQGVLGQQLLAGQQREATFLGNEMNQALAAQEAALRSQEIRNQDARDKRGFRRGLGGALITGGFGLLRGGAGG